MLVTNNLHENEEEDDDDERTNQVDTEYIIEFVKSIDTYILF